MNNEALNVVQLYISPKEAAKRYGISVSSMRRLYNNPDFPEMMKIGNRLSINLVQLDEYMKRFVVEK